LVLNISSNKKVNGLPVETMDTNSCITGFPCEKFLNPLCLYPEKPDLYIKGIKKCHYLDYRE